MGLRWTAEQLAIYNLIQSGAANKDLKAQGYKTALVKKVRAAMNKGDAPAKAHEEKEEKEETKPGEPLYSATLRTTKVTLDPIVAVRYDSVRHALNLGDDYTLQRFIDESTDIVAELVGAVPPGFVKEEQSEKDEARGEMEVASV